MPLYEYLCTACGERTEVLRGFNQPPLTECPQCGGLLTKLASAPAIQFKGSGFYLTDYGRAGGRKSESETGKSESAGDKAPASTDSQPSQEGKSTTEGKSSNEGKSSSEGKSSNEGKSTKDGKSPNASKSSTEGKPAAPAKPST
jgi:putative FmdB family regulatory protein